jgi:hypothetical protein
MSAAEIIREIDALPPSEMAQVVRHAKALDERRPLSPEELGDLAHRLAEAGDSPEGQRLRLELVEGFYGER